jgi:hypothetical protein
MCYTYIGARNTRKEMMFPEGKRKKKWQFMSVRFMSENKGL